MPSIFPFSSIFIFSAAGTLGNPGIVIIFPAKTTIKPAPAFSSTSLTLNSKDSVQSNFFASSENEYWVFAIHTGKFANPISSIFLMFSSASSL